MPYISGRDLTARQREQVKSAFVHRSTYEHPRPQYGGEPRMSDRDWIDSHSFNFTKAGHIGRGGARSANPSTVDARTVLKSGRSMLARVKRVGNKLVIQPVATAAKRAVKRVRRMANPNGGWVLQERSGGTNRWIPLGGNTPYPTKAEAVRRAKVWANKGFTVRVILKREKGLR